MRKLLTIAAVAALVVLAAASSPAQIVANDAYQVGYYDHNRGIHIINTGQIGSPIDPTTNHGTVCADIYLFDTNQEMLACCSCPLTANALVHDLSARSLTNAPFIRGVLKIVADAGCDETNITTPVNGGLRASLNNALLEGVPAAIVQTENWLERAPLTAQEQQFLGQTCAFVHYLGSGVGVCSCTAE